MIIYSGVTGGHQLVEMRELGMGVMISSYPGISVTGYEGLPLALDNGAFSIAKKKLGFKFDEYVFLQTFSACCREGLYLNFVVSPDIVAGGLKSLDFSIRWADRLPFERWALAVQDGIQPHHITPDVLKRFTTIFIGGTPEWKWQTAHDWVTFAHSNNLKAHIGQCGKLERLRYAASIGADSVDSVSFVRNHSLYIVREFYNPTIPRII